MVCTASASRVVNALSTALDVEIQRDGPVWTAALRPLGPPARCTRSANRRAKTGTTITFWADPAIFETTDYNFETISRRLQEMAFLNKGLTIVLRDEREPEGAERRRPEIDDAPDAEGYVAKVKERTFHYPGGLEDFVTHLNHAKDPIHKKPVAFEAEGDRASRSRSRCSGTPATPSRSTPSPTPSTPTRAAPTRRASAPR